MGSLVIIVEERGVVVKLMGLGSGSSEVVLTGLEVVVLEGLESGYQKGEDCHY